ncbi:helix-turn-helix domain-containing protein, partial [Proteus mirabilis]
MEQQGLTNKDMTQFMGSLSKVSEVLNRKRPLSLSMIRRLHDGLGIPADILIQDMNDVEWLEIDAKLTSEKFNFAITPEVSDQDNYENSLSR